MLIQKKKKKQKKTAKKGRSQDIHHFLIDYFKFLDEMVINYINWKDTCSFRVVDIYKSAFFRPLHMYVLLMGLYSLFSSDQTLSVSIYWLHHKKHS